MKNENLLIFAFLIKDYLKFEQAIENQELFQFLKLEAPKPKVLRTKLNYIFHIKNVSFIFFLILQGGRKHRRKGRRIRGKRKRRRW